MKLVKLVEKNSWERETWNWWFDENEYIKHKDMFDSLQKLLSVSNNNKEDNYTFDFNSVDDREINWSDDRNSYYAYNNPTGRRVDLDKLLDLLCLAPEDIGDSLYKGKIRRIFK